MNLQAFEKVLATDSLILHFSPDWVDSKSIRQAMQNFEGINIESSPPVSSNGGISVSHSKLGGTILLSKHSGIGVDIEVRERLTSNVINRVSSKEELNTAPDPLFLWPAKEASFKALYPDNEDIAIPQLIIQKWDEISPKIWSFQGSYQQKSIKGFLFSDDFLLVAAAKIRL